MFYADYHIHSKYSYDGCEELSTICERAVSRGLTEIAVTDHMDIYAGLPYGQLRDFDVPGGRIFYMDVKGLYKELEELRSKYAGRLTVRLGTEFGQPQANPESAKAFMADYGDVLDFVIGSIHNPEDDRDVYYYDFEAIDVGAMYDVYVNAMLELAKEGDFDVMGHLTYPLRYLHERREERLDLTPYMERFRLLFGYLIEGGKGIELNVSGLYRSINETMPPMELVKLYRECGGEIITIGSDAHKAEYVGAYQKEGQELLRAAGFRYVTAFCRRRPEFHKL